MIRIGQYVEEIHGELRQSLLEWHGAWIWHDERMVEWQ